MNKHEIQYDIDSHSICLQNTTSEEDKEYHSKKIKELLELLKFKEEAIKDE